MGEFLVLIVLGVVQGLCEFLPISSSGHLLLLATIFGVEDSLFVSIVLHMATLLAVIVVMRKKVWQLIKHPFSQESLFLMVATIFTCLVAILIMPLITSAFEGKSLPIFFLLSALVLIFAQKFNGKVKGKMSYKRAIIVGLAQGLAIFPGLSRSGTTISAGMISGLSGEDSGEFSFLLSIPIIIGSMLMEIIKVTVAREVVSVNLWGLALAFCVAFIVGLASIKYMLKLTKRANFKYFAVYLIILSIISIFFVWR
jgi:undecaprenyl-diphosphatase